MVMGKGYSGYGYRSAWNDPGVTHVLSSFATGASVIVAQLCSKLSSVCGSKLREREGWQSMAEKKEDSPFGVLVPQSMMTWQQQPLTTLYTLEKQWGKAEYSGGVSSQGKGAKANGELQKEELGST
ncbi:hypothetical protein EI94DRAFT_1705596 [Lactarius quietus]|nr:hypothetical protein EI94DRAFT_1705596 [Lactarius quietus]